jgi:hypothetical protein
MSKCQYFEHVPEYSVAACRECRYAVWPDQIEGHLQEQHKVSCKKAKAVGEEVRTWARLVQYPIPGRDLHPALSGGWLGTRFTHLPVYISSHTLGGLNFKVSVEVRSQRWIRLKFRYVTQRTALHCR